MSLLRTAARASVATRVVGNTHRRQQQRWAAQDGAQAAASAPAVPGAAPAPAATPAPAAPAAPSGTDAMLEQLRQLGELRAAGILTDAEFEAQKQRVLAGA